MSVATGTKLRGITAELGDIGSWFMAMLPALLAFAEEFAIDFWATFLGEGWNEVDDSKWYSAAQEGIVETIIVVSVMVAVGVLVLIIVFGVTDDASEDQPDSPLNETLETFYGHLDSTFILVAVALIMLVIGVVIAVLRGGMN